VVGGATADILPIPALTAFHSSTTTHTGDPDSETQTKSGTITLPYIPTIGPPLRRILQKAGFNTVFKSGTSLKNILCLQNKDKPPIHRAIYKLNCDCNPSPSMAYIGQLQRRVDQRMNKHRGYVRRGENLSGIAQHKNSGCGGFTDFTKPEILATVRGKSKAQIKYFLDIRESMEIKCHQTRPGKGFNENWGNRAKTRQWDPLFSCIRSDDDTVPKKI
jgi:hypothetical protein